MHEYRTGERAKIGDRVSHYVDGDEGRVVALDSDGRSLTVVWERDGEQEHFADECGLISRGVAS